MVSRLDRLMGVLSVLVFGAGIGFAIGTWRTMRENAAERAELVAARRDNAAMQRFIGLVVDDVEKSVDRAAGVLSDSGEFVRPQRREDPPIFYGAGSWWVVSEGKCLRVDHGSVQP